MPTRLGTPAALLIDIQTLFVSPLGYLEIASSSAIVKSAAFALLY